MLFLQCKKSRPFGPGLFDILFLYFRFYISVPVTTKVKIKETEEESVVDRHFCNCVFKCTGKNEIVKRKI